MTTKIKRQLLFLLALALLFASGFALEPIQSMRTRHNLTNEPEKGLTPQLALATQMLGWGRGLIIDVIWIRMESLKQDQRFFELVQLADWACKLAPRFPQVWDIQSWNLAYNVSAKVEHLPDRWAWVRTGLELLRDQGIPLNPYSPMLYDRLAWTYFHKIGEQDDNAHFFYKQRFGLLMHRAIGGEGSEEALKAFIEAPKTREELLKDELTRRLVKECANHGFDLVAGFWEVYDRAPSVPAAVVEIIRRPHYVEAMRKIRTYARARHLEKELKLDPERMLALREKYGPLDWRSAYAHAVYWGTIGLEKLKELEARTLGTYEGYGVDYKGALAEGGSPWKAEEGLYEYQRVNLKRVIYASMQSLCHQGRLLFDTKGRLLLEVGADYRFADATLPLFKEFIDAHGGRYEVGTRDAYRHFLRRGVFEFALAGEAGDQARLRKAVQYFKLLKEDFPEEVGDLSFEDYLVERHDRFSMDMTTMEVRRWVTSQVMAAFIALGCDAEDKAAVLELAAIKRARQWNADAERNLRGRVRYGAIREAVLIDLLSGRVALPPGVLENLKARLNATAGDRGLVARILANIETGATATPEAEEVEEKWRMETR